MKKIAINILLGLISIVIGIIKIGKKIQIKINNERNISNKYLALFLMMNQWVKIKQEGKFLSSYFEENGYNEIAIYGIGYAGKTLIDELKGSSIKIKYGIDRKADNIYEEFNVISPQDKLENVDVIIVTAIKSFNDIEEILSEKVNCPIISLEDILYEM